jgi:hypothetical protein
VLWRYYGNPLTQRQAQWRGSLTPLHAVADCFSTDDGLRAGFLHVANLMDRLASSSTTADPTSRMLLQLAHTMYRTFIVFRLCLSTCFLFATLVVASGGAFTTRRKQRSAWMGLIICTSQIIRDHLADWEHSIQDIWLSRHTCRSHDFGSQRIGKEVLRVHTLGTTAVHYDARILCCCSYDAAIRCSFYLPRKKCFRKMGHKLSMMGYL